MLKKLLVQYERNVCKHATSYDLRDSPISIFINRPIILIMKKLFEYSIFLVFI